MPERGVASDAVVLQSPLSLVDSGGVVRSVFRADSSMNQSFGLNGLQANTTGTDNTNNGANGLQANTTGNYNTNTGANGLYNNTTGNNNTNTGQAGLQNNTTGTNNTNTGQAGLQNNTTGTNNTNNGYNGLASNTTGNNNTNTGVNGLFSNTTGNSNTNNGQAGGYAPAGVTANATTTAVGQTLNGYRTGQGTATQANYISTLGYQCLVDNDGGVAIGADHTGANAHANAQDEIALGTALHQVRIRNNTTGTGSALLGGNCPATTVSAPYTWFKMTSGDGSTVYLPAWK